MSRHRGEEGTLVGHAPLERAMVLAPKPAHFQDWRKFLLDFPYQEQKLRAEEMAQELSALAALPGDLL